ncbi:MAG: type II restriction endonuclease [Candidatus Aminicenantes bacterium]|nr:type II restriction endonuclease [Candidatus Aminicenantes bacterium]
MKENIYLDFLKTSDLEKVKLFFFNTLLLTNHDHKFFVDWNKVRNKVKEYEIALNILNTLIRNDDFDKTLRIILNKYPEVLPCIPLLLAVREYDMYVMEDFKSNPNDIIHYDFSKRKLTKEETEQIVAFIEKTGLKSFFQELSTASLQDYMYGIEVGTDSNARKNRSGSLAEEMLGDEIEKVKHEAKIKIIMAQKTFKQIEKLGFSVPKSLRERKADFIVIKESEIAIDIEVNFYNVGGSKPQEIVDSYIHRQEELKQAGIKLVWVTDGPGWKSGPNQLDKALDEIDYILNFKLVKLGLLKKVLKEI